MTTWTVKPGGVDADYDSLSAALSNGSTIAGDIIEITGDWTSTTDTTAATVADNNITIRTGASDQARHAGVDNAGTNYELAVASAHCITVNNTGCKIDGLLILQNGTGSSDECIRLGADVTFTAVDTILRCANNTSDQDGIYAGTVTATINCENVIAIGAGRAGFQAQMSSAGAADTQTWNLISCTAWNCGRNSGEADGGGISAQARNASSVANLNCFNCLFVINTAASSEDYNNASGTNNGTRTWNIDDCGEGVTRANIASLDGGAVRAVTFDTVTDGTPGAANEVCAFNDITSAPYDLRLQDHANNDAQDVTDHTGSTGAGLTFGDYVGSAVDIVGTARPTNTNNDFGAFEVAAAGAFTLDAVGGSYTWTGSAAGVVYDSKLAAAAGSYTWTGSAAGLDITMPAGAGSYAWTGSTAGLLHTSNIVAAAGSYAWTGADATLTYTAPGTFELTADAGSYAWTGSTAGLVYDSVIAAAAGAYTWTGSAATLVYSTVLTAAAGSYTWTGAAASFLVDSVLTAGAGSYLWTGTAAGLVYDSESEGAGKRKRRYILPDGREVASLTDAYTELDRQVRARAAELVAERVDLPRAQRSRRQKRSRSIHPPKLMTDMPLPQLIERLPKAERAKVDMEIIEAVQRLAQQREEEEAIVALLILAV